MAELAATPDSEIAERIEAFLESDPEFADAPAAGNEKKKKVAQPTSINPVPDPARPETAEEDDEAPAKAPTPESEDDESEGAAEAEGEGEAQPDDEAAAGEAASIESVGDLARAFGVDEDTVLDTLSVVPGEGAEPVPLRALIERYNAEPELVVDPVAENVYKAKRAELEEHLGSKFNELQVVTSAMLDILEVDRKTLESLRDDPTEYIKQRDRVDRQQTAIQNSIEKMKRMSGEMESSSNQDYQQTLSREATTLLAKMPAWKEEANRTSAMKQINTHLKAQGFGDEEVANLMDHRMVMIAYQASEYARLKAKVTGASDKKLLKLPKVTMGKTARDESRPQRAAEKRRSERWARLEQTGSDNDAAALIAELELADL